MSECVIFNKYIFIYIYICLFHFVVNEEKLFIRYNGGEEEYEFTLDLNTEGGLELYKRLKEKKRIELTFKAIPLAIACVEDDNFPSLIKNNPTEKIDTEIGDISASNITFYISVINAKKFANIQKIGHLIQKEGSSIEELKSLVVRFSSSGINLELILETDEIDKPDITKIAEINKKIIIIAIIGLSILIIFIIIKFIV